MSRASAHAACSHTRSVIIRSWLSWCGARKPTASRLECIVISEPPSVKMSLIFCSLRPGALSKNRLACLWSQNMLILTNLWKRNALRRKLSIEAISMCLAMQKCRRFWRKFQIIKCQLSCKFLAGHTWLSSCQSSTFKLRPWTWCLSKNLMARSCKI